jgi:hypothetical protein
VILAGDGGEVNRKNASVWEGAEGFNANVRRAYYAENRLFVFSPPLKIPRRCQAPSE